MSDTEPATPPLDPLTELAIRHGTDKWGPHFYTPIYHALFAHLRDRPVRLLEIGIGGYHLNTVGGSSLAMWAEYFPQGHIVGLDIMPKRLSLGPRVTTVAGSQTDTRLLAALCDRHGPFDIVIDDGSHCPNHVSTSFYALFPRLADGGLYVIEDVQTAFWPEYGGSVLDGGETMKLVTRLVECLNHAEIKVVQPSGQVASFASQVRSLRAFHNIIAIEKGDNGEPSNARYSLANPHAARAVRTIEAAMARAPTPEGLANLIDVYMMAGEVAKGAALVGDALAKWPDHPALLSVASQIAQARGDARGNLDCLRRLARLEPDNAALQQACDEAQAAMAAAAPGPG